jgi:hypothetical protein
MRNVSDKSCRENQNTHFVFSNVFFEIRAVYEILWKNTVERGRPQMTVWRMRIACWTTKATHTRNCNTYCFSLQQLLHERAPTLSYTDIASLVKLQFVVRMYVVTTGLLRVKELGFDVENQRKWQQKVLVVGILCRLCWTWWRDFNITMFQVSLTSCGCWVQLLATPLRPSVSSSTFHPHSPPP